MNAARIIPRPAAKFMDRMVRENKWQPERVPAEVVGLTRDVTVYRDDVIGNLGPGAS